MTICLCKSLRTCLLRTEFGIVFNSLYYLDQISRFKLAGNRDVITLDHSYHGHVMSLIDISPYKFNKPGLLYRFIMVILSKKNYKRHCLYVVLLPL